MMLPSSRRTGGVSSKSRFGIGPIWIIVRIKRLAGQVPFRLGIHPRDTGRAMKRAAKRQLCGGWKSSNSVKRWPSYSPPQLAPLGAPHSGDTRVGQPERYRKMANIMRASVGAPLLREDRDLRFRLPRSGSRRYSEPIGSLGTMTNSLSPSCHSPLFGVYESGSSPGDEHGSTAVERRAPMTAQLRRMLTRNRSLTENTSFLFREGVRLFLRAPLGACACRATGRPRGV